jgi:3D (Asp-Asp-Asp) domain-containing protein
MAATPSGRGYWLLDADGGVFSFGDAVFRGALANSPGTSTAVSITSTPSGNGYWIATTDGGVFTFGDARYRGSLATEHPGAPVVALRPTPSGGGYWVVTGQPQATRVHLGSFTATCYSLPGTTATGAPVSDAVVAVDPSVIPLGTHLYISGLGERTASDTGGAIRGNRLDIWMGSYSACVQFGRQNVDVFRVS